MPLPLVRSLVELVAPLIHLADVVLEWLITYAIHSTLLIGAVWVATSGPLVRRLRLTSMSGLWLLALAGGMITATLQATGALTPLAGTLRLARESVTGARVRVEVRRGGPRSEVRGQRVGGAIGIVDRPVWTTSPSLPLRARGPISTVSPTAWYAVSPRPSAPGPRPSTIGPRPPALGPAPSALGPAFARLSARSGPILVTARVDLSPKWPLLVVLLWLMGAGTFVGAFLYARRRFLRTIGERTDAEFTLAGNALREVCQRSRVRRWVSLTVAEGLTSPVALSGDEICLPRRALAELDPIHLESMVAHELAHLERRDPQWLVVARVIEAVFFFQPLNRLARRRMQESSEYASDLWALRATRKPLELARCLMRLAEWTVSHERLLAPALAEHRGSVLVQRVERLTSPRVVADRSVGPRLQLAAAGGLLALALVAPRAVVGAPKASGSLAPPAGQVFFLQRDAVGVGGAGVGAGRIVRLHRDETGDKRQQTGR